MPFPAEYGSKPYQFIPSPNDNYTLASEGPLARSSKAGNEITSICFDSSHELFWTGNASGRVSGFTTDTMKQVFTFNESRSYIQNLDVYDDIVITVTSNSVAGFQRSGHVFFRAHLPCFQDLKCIHRPSTNQNTVFIGGKQNDLIIFDLESQTDVKIISDENSSASQIRSNHSNIFCSNDKGVITIRSHNGEKLSEIQAHYGPITGFDICDNKLVTAGCTIKSGYNDPFGTPRGDPFLKVYDLRYMTAVQPISTPFPPQHVFFADSLNTGKIVLTSHFGRIWTTNINNNSSTNFIHELPIYAHIQHAALSSSHQTLAVVDNQQCGHIYSMYSPVRGCYGVVNFNSRSLTSSSYQPYDGYYDGMNSRDTMSSSPANCQNYYNNSTAFNDGTYGMQNLNVSGNSGSYGHQPPKSRTNPDAAFVLRNAVKGPIPIYSAEFFNDYEFRSEDLSLPEWNHEESEKNIPRLYSRPTDKDRHDRIVYERFNNSTQVPLLTNPNAPIVNCVLRALSAVPLLKKIVLSHLCKKPNCMLCEIQFVLRNIYLQEQNNSVAPVTCSAVVREMSAYRDFTIIKQLSPTAFSGLPMSLFCNFFFQHIFSDSQLTYNEKTVTESEQFNKLMMISQQTKEACNSCGSIEDYEKTRHIIHLDYSKFFGQVENVPFAQLLEASFEHETDNKFPIQCRKCYRMAGRRRISHNTVLPPVLTIDTDITKTGYAFWVNHADPYNDRPRNSMNGYDSRFVRDGSPHEWLQPTNVFEHSVRSVSHAVHSGGHWSHYIPSMISATIDPKNGKVSVSVQISKQPNRKIYSLCSVVMTAADVNNPERFIVACKNQNPTSPLLNWTIFNDYIVTAVKEDEALFTSSKWKMPHLLFYCDIEHLNQTMEPIKIPREVFAYFENSKTKNLSHERAPPPEEGEIVALDSEFIRNEQNENVLGRVSCLNKEGNIVIDDYAMLGCGERISDYLTQYSGIVQEDLDPSLSQKYLLSRKNTYLKVLYLVENKNIFVGHALHNDFKILNIYVPDEQIIDTCQLYRIEGRQFLSLRDLVKIVLGDEIQSHRHDSVEDALCALRLFNKFNEHKEKNSNIESWLQIIYDEAQRHSVSRQRYSPQTGGLENFMLPNNGFLSYMYSPS